jgi:tRNA G18 (ribose-2'-O)-methylase SpoU
MKTTITKILSENSQFQYIETLQRNRTKRNRAREFVVEGVRSINQAIYNHWTINALVYTRDKRLSDWAEGVIERTGTRNHFVLPISLMGKLSQKEDTSELVAIVAMPDDDLARISLRKALLVVVLDRPNNPGNLGTVIRSCDALQVDGVVITGHSVDLYDPETIRATTGSFFNLPVIRLPSYKGLTLWLEGLKERLVNIQVVGTSAMADIPIQDYDFTAPIILLVGNETHGLSGNLRTICDAMVTIPMYGSATSLNLACATSILLYEVDRQRRKVGVISANPVSRP